MNLKDLHDNSAGPVIVFLLDVVEITKQAGSMHIRALLRSRLFRKMRAMLSKYEAKNKLPLQLKYLMI